MILPVDAAEKDPMKVRVPADQLAAAQKLKNPVAATDVVAKGKNFYEGKRHVSEVSWCHGAGDGPGAKLVRPSPRNLTNHEWQKAGPMANCFWIIKNSSPGTGMVSHSLRYQ